MSEENRRERRQGDRTARKLAFEDADRTFAEVDRESLTPKLPLDPPKLQWKDTVGDPQPKSIVLDPPKPPWWEVGTVDPKWPVLDQRHPWPEPEPKSVISDQGGLDPKQIIDPPKHLIDPPKPQWKDLIGDPEPKRIIGDPKPPKNDLDPDSKSILDPKQFLDPVKTAALDPGDVFDPGRVINPGAVSRRPFVLGMPHHAPSAGTMAGADPRAAMMEPHGDDGPAHSAAYLEAMLGQVEASMRTLKEDLESLDDYYRRLRERLDEVEKSQEDGNGGSGGPEEEEDPQG